MNNLSITVNVPALGGTYDFIIPPSMMVQDAIHLIVRILNSEYGIAERLHTVQLFDLKDGRMLRQNYTLAQMGILDGTELILL